MKYQLYSLMGLIGCVAMARADDSDKLAFFEAKIRPVLVDSCQQCHGEKKAS